MRPGGTLAASEITVHRGAEAILERVTLVIQPGSRIGVVGANGRGKTTLLRALAGLEPAEAAAHRLERLEQARVEKPWQPWDLRFALAPARRAGDLVVELDKAVVERGRFRLGPLDLCLSWGERLSIAGSNGSGKSTLLDVVLGRLPLASGTRRVGPSVVFGKIGQQRPRFDGSRPTIELFCSETGMSPGEARTLLAKFDLYADHVARAAETLSPGERTRAELAVQAVLGANCLVLDEPTNHLDLPAIEELERALAGTRGR